MSYTERAITASATIGRVYAVISAIFGTLIGLAMIISGIYIMKHRSHLKTTKGIVVPLSEDSEIGSECQTTKSKKGSTSLSCVSYVSYKIGENEYSHVQVNTGSSRHNVGDELTLYYDPKNPENPEVNPIPKSIGLGILIGGVFVLFGSWLWVYLTMESKDIAAVGGAVTVAKMFRN